MLEKIFNQIIKQKYVEVKTAEVISAFYYLPIDAHL